MRFSTLQVRRQHTLLTLLLGCLAYFAVACGTPIFGTGEILTQTLHNKGFTRVEVHSSLQVRIAYGKKYAGKIVAHGNLMDMVQIEQHGEVLQIRLKNNIKIIEGLAEVSLVMPRLVEFRVVAGNKVTIPMLETRGNLRLDFSGQSGVSGEVKTDGLIDIEVAGGSFFTGTLRSARTTWKLTGGSATTARIYAKDTNLDASGNSSVDFSGIGERFVFELAGGSNGNFKHFLHTSIDATLSGSSAGLIRLNGTLTALIEGLSHLYYQGTPKVERLKTTGGGRLLPQEAGNTQEP